MPESIRRRKSSAMPARKSAPRGSTVTDRLIDSALRADSVMAVTAAGERRRVKRVPYPAWVALLLVSPQGDRGRPMILRSRDISLHGIRVISRNMIYPGSQGVMQLMRSDGRLALVGVAVKSSRYSGNMEHQTGLQFSPLPRGWVTEEFVDRRGQMLLLHPKLRDNIEKE
jgi:hypothetical protein